MQDIVKCAKLRNFIKVSFDYNIMNKYMFIDDQSIFL